MFDCAGNERGLEAAFDAIAFGGSFVSIAMWEKPVTYPRPVPVSTVCLCQTDANPVVSILPKRDQGAQFVLLHSHGLRKSHGPARERYSTILQTYLTLSAADMFCPLIGKLKGYEEMVTGRIGLEDVVQKGFEELINNKDDHVKILITPKTKTDA